LPAELQREVEALVEQTRQRSGWSARQTLAALGVSRASYYRWLKDQKWQTSKVEEPVRVVQAYEATEEEQQKVWAYALKHAAIRHRELAWRMVDEGVVCLSPSTVYRILREKQLVSPWRRRKKRSRQELEKAQRPDERWGTDLMQIQIQGRPYYLLTFIDEYSRYLVHYELLTNMEGLTVSLEAQRAIEGLLRERGGEIPGRGMPEVRSDNGSCYISRDFRKVLDEHQLSHHLIRPHCPEENGITERANRTFRDALDEVDLEDAKQARQFISRMVTWYNHERLHRALGYLKPIDYYRGKPAELHEARREKLAEARHHRRETNLALRQRMLRMSAAEAVTC
jgi:putative transposase